MTTATDMGPASRYAPLIPGHRMGYSSRGAERTLWCSCGWKWKQEDPKMDLNVARRLEREQADAHRALASPPKPQGSEDWCREPT